MIAHASSLAVAKITAFLVDLARKRKFVFVYCILPHLTPFIGKNWTRDRVKTETCLQFCTIRTSGKVRMQDPFVVNRSNCLRKNNTSNTTLFGILLEMRRVNDLQLVFFVVQKACECHSGQRHSCLLQVWAENILRVTVLLNPLCLDLNAACVRDVGVGLRSQ